MCPLIGLITAHRAVRHNKTGDVVRSKVINEILYPSVVLIVKRWYAELPAFILFLAFTTPIRIVERRISQNKFGFEVLRGVQKFL